MATIIPDKLYVTIQTRKDSIEALLGFSSPYTSDAAFEKRKIIQDRCEYGCGGSRNVVTNFDISDYISKSIWLVGGDFSARVLPTVDDLSKFVRNF